MLQKIYMKSVLICLIRKKNNMLIERIKKHSTLSKFVHPKCEDEGICVDIDNRILSDNVVVIKVDDYYNSLNLFETPASPDCLIILKCKNSGYAIYIVELKGIKSTKRFTVKNMDEKFSTCIYDFICKKFKDLLDIDYKRINLYFVSNIKIYKRDAALSMKILQSRRFKYRNKKYFIEPKMPIPAIKPCY